MKDFILQQQCPPVDAAQKRAEASLTSSSAAITSRCCQCPHLLDVLPEELDLTFAKSETRGWILRNPVHAMHLASQLEAEQEHQQQQDNQQDHQQPPLLYGDEQERSLAITTQGIPETWHPYIQKDTSTTAFATDWRLPAATETNQEDARFAAMYAQEQEIRNVQARLASKRTIPLPNNSAANSNKKRIPAAAAAATGRMVTPNPPPVVSSAIPLHPPVSNPLAHAIPTSTTSATYTGTVADPLAAPSTTATSTLQSSTQQPQQQQPAPVKPIPTVHPLARPIIHMSQSDQLAWDAKHTQAQQQVTKWLEQYKMARRAFYYQQTVSQKQQQQQGATTTSKSNSSVPSSFFVAERQAFINQATLSCHVCQQQSNGDDDAMMQCLDCSFVGCSSQRKHMMEHMVLKHHNFAVTCGPQAKLYCFACGDFVSHTVFEQERERVDLMEHLPWMAWKDHPLQRSFDALRFMRILDHGIVWRNMAATYPQLVTEEHLKAARLCRWRQALFHGQAMDLPEGIDQQVQEFVRGQHQKDRCMLATPVGMYNLGNSCYMTAILQCLSHCAPVQQYFLEQIGHPYRSCSIYQEHFEKKNVKSYCLACEMDKLFVSYFESCNGCTVAPLLKAERMQVTSDSESPVYQAKNKGEPLVPSDMLTVAWRCMPQVAGYEQRDAHEFLHSFLDVLGKHCRQFRVRVHNALNIPHPKNAFLPDFDPAKQDLCKNIFEGTFRSVLVCKKCGNKRTQTEPFMSISLPLSKEIGKAAPNDNSDSNNTDTVTTTDPITVERCLKHFTLPEQLADPVDCPSCGEKTPTTKQHVISRLPKILVLHLKRFDAAANRKIEEFVSFPAHGLNMGPYLPHWSEISQIPNNSTASTGTDNESPTGGTSDTAPPIIHYSLQSTVNHFGSLQSGHYYANVKISNQWYHCNDAHVSYAEESEVLAQEGAYMLVYARQ